MFDINNIMDAILYNEQLTQEEKEWLLDLVSNNHPDVIALTISI